VKLKTVKIWKCECGNQDQTNIILAPDGEVVCGKCGIVLGEVATKKSENFEEEADSWDGEADLCRKLLEDRVSKKGWEF
jgi:transcription initiation factor TFIIIB Brf1 subunit/transcription initiation factor TFIIB